MKTIRGPLTMDATMQKSCVVWESDDQQRSRALVHSRVKRHPSPPSYLSVLAMARTATEVFLVTICAWLELDRSMTSELLYKVEEMSDFLAKIIRHIGYSCLTEHLATVWVLSRRALCIMRRVPIEHTVNITIAFTWHYQSAAQRLSDVTVSWTRQH